MGNSTPVLEASIRQLGPPEFGCLANLGQQKAFLSLANKVRDVEGRGRSGRDAEGLDIYHLIVNEIRRCVSYEMCHVEESLTSAFIVL